MKKLIMVLAMLMAMPCQAEYVTAESGLCVRSEPKEDAEVLEVLPIGTEVPGGSGWIRYGEGYISAEWVGEENPLEYLGEWRVTAYAYTGSACANGEYPEAGRTIAHNSLSFGTKVYIEGVGVREVMDRGPGWLGDAWCDLYLGDTVECIAWGDQVREVWRLK